MADVKISQLPASTTPLDGTEVLPIVQSATTKQVSVANLTAGRAVSALSLSLTNALPVTSGGTGIASADQGALLSATGVNTFSATRTPTLGLAGTAAGTLGLSGSTSGVVTLATQNTAGTWTMKLPTTAGTNNYLLKTDGSGNTDWVNPTALGIDLDVGTTAITGGTTGRVLYDNAGVLGEYSFVPVSFGGTGLTSLTANRIPYASATDTLGTSANFTYDGSTLSLPGAISSGTGISTGDASFELGGNRTGSGTAYIDLHATASTDYEARVIRATGADGNFSFYNTGAGTLTFSQTSASPINFTSNNVSRIYIDTAGKVGINNPSPAVLLDITGGVWNQSSGSEMFNLITRTGAGGANNYIGNITWQANNSSSATKGYAKILTQQLVATAAAEDGLLAIQAAKAGNLNSYITINGNADTLVFGNSTGIKVTIDASGNLGVGTTSPTGRVHGRQDSAGGTTYTLIADNGAGGAGINLAAVAFQNGGTQKASIRAAVYGSGYMAFHTDNDTEKMRIDGTGGFRVRGAGTAGSTDAFLVDGSAPASAARIDASGNLLVGTTSGAGKISSYGDITTKTALVLKNTSSTTGGSYIEYRNSSDALAGYVYQSGSTAVTYTNTSDYRLKENIRPISNALADVCSLKPVWFDWKADKSSSRGFIAHEVQEVFSEAVAGTKDQIDENGNIKPQGVDYGRITPLLTAAIQELAAKVSALEARQ